MPEPSGLRSSKKTNSGGQKQRQVRETTRADGGNHSEACRRQLDFFPPADGGDFSGSAGEDDVGCSSSSAAEAEAEALTRAAFLKFYEVNIYIERKKERKKERREGRKEGRKGERMDGAAWYPSPGEARKTGVPKSITLPPPSIMIVSLQAS